MELNPGSSLVFGEKAHVTNAFSPNKDVKLNVFMNGGTLDDSQLSPAARQRIRRIYPKPADRFADNVRVLQNPTPSDLLLDLVSDGEAQVFVAIHDLQGQLVWSKTFEAVEGHNLLNCDWGNLGAGVYMASVSGPTGRATMKVIHI
jgi:hypothetical protein